MVNKKIRNSLLVMLALYTGIFTCSKINEHSQKQVFRSRIYSICLINSLPINIEGAQLYVKRCDFNADSKYDLIEYFTKDSDGLEQKIMTCKDTNSDGISNNECLFNEDFEKYFKITKGKKRIV